ncbi:MAG: DUF4011 domain-containing protein, partial [Promethearchaeota archaeon]
METEPTNRARAKLQFWKSSFLDLSYRNNQLNFNPMGKNVIEILHQDSSAFFKILVIMQQTFTIPSVYSPSKRKIKSTKEPQKLKILEIPSKIASSLTSPHIRALNKKKKDLRLTELLTYENDINLKKKIGNLRAKTEEMLEERGINTLFLTFGLLNWQEPNEKQSYTSPILFIPIEIKANPL